MEVKIDADLVTAVNSGEISQEVALLTQLLRNQETEVKKKPGLTLVPKSG